MGQSGLHAVFEPEVTPPLRELGLEQGVTMSGVIAKATRVVNTLHGNSLLGLDDRGEQGVFLPLSFDV